MENNMKTTYSIFRRSEFSFGVTDSAGRELGVKYQIERGNDGTYTILFKPTRAGEDYGAPVSLSGENGLNSIKAAEAWVAAYRKECGAELVTKTFSFGISDQYGRDCGFTYWIDPPASHYRTQEIIHVVCYQAERGGRKYQAVKHVSLPTAEAALEKAEALAEQYRQRCAKQFATKPSDAAAA
jgi:hypothetical protein